MPRSADAKSFFNLHLLGGALLVLPLVFFPGPISAFFVFALWGWLREGASHKEDGPWVGWWTWHRALEGLSWGAGAGIVWGILLFWIR